MRVRRGKVLRRPTRIAKFPSPPKTAADYQRIKEETIKDIQRIMGIKGTKKEDPIFDEGEEGSAELFDSFEEVAARHPEKAVKIDEEPKR